MKLFLLFLFILSGLLFSDFLQENVTKGEINVFCAISALEPVKAIKERFESKHDLHININAASSSILAKQIESGSYADIYISANKKWFDYLDQKKIFDDRKKRRLITNQLVLVKNRLSKKKVLFDIESRHLICDGYIAIADSNHVPQGMYTKSLLEHLGVWMSVQDKLVVAKDALHTIKLIDHNKASCGFVYKTDCLLSENVQIIEEIDPALVNVEYFCALISKHDDKGFFDYLFSNESKKIFEEYGFNLN